VALVALAQYPPLLTDDEDYEEPGGWNYFLGFMFGNVYDSGDLDADYLDEVYSF
jgi:hypothetical protein